MYFAQFSNGVDIGDLVVSGTKVDNVGSVRNPIQVFQAAIAYRQGAESMQFFSQNSEKKKNTKKMYFVPKNCNFSIFGELQNEKGFFQQFNLCSNLLSKWRKVASKSHFYFAVQEKRLKKQFFGMKYIFINVAARFVCKHF